MKKKLLFIFAALLTIAQGAWAWTNGAMNGQFSVSAVKKVVFSQGNLKYNGSTYSFATNQYDYIGASQADDNKDLFNWQSANSSISVGGTTGWSVLTKDEWTYLLGRSSSSLRTKATVCDVKGLILMPDGWTAGSVSLTVTTANYTTNTISTSQWTTLEAEGCVFLPAAGKNDGSGNAFGGFLGYKEGTCSVTNSLFAPASVTVSTDYAGTFSRPGAPTITNCYYTRTFGGAQGIQACTIAKGDGVSTLSVSKGSGTTYNVAGITVYSNGVDYNSTFYGGSGQSVSLTLAAETRDGYQFKQYATTGGTITAQTETSASLTMPAANVTISAEYDPLYNATFADGNDNTGWDIDPTSGIEGSTVTVSYVGPHKVKSVSVTANPSTLAGLKAAINNASDLTDLNTKVLGKYVTATGAIQSSSEGAVGIIAYISKTAVDNSFADSRIFVLATENASNSAQQAPSNTAETTYNSTSDLNGYAVTNAWQAAGYAASTAGWNYSASRPEGASHWFVPSYGQWMLGGWNDGNNRPCRLMRLTMEGSGKFYAVSTAINVEGDNNGYCVDGSWWGMGSIQRIQVIRVRAAFVF